MRTAGAVLVLAILTSACGQEPSPKQAEVTNEAAEQDLVKERQLSIEQAAEEATKIIEADAKAEIDANAAKMQESATEKAD